MSKNPLISFQEPAFKQIKQPLMSLLLNASPAFKQINLSFMSLVFHASPKSVQIQTTARRRRSSLVSEFLKRNGPIKWVRQPCE